MGLAPTDRRVISLRLLGSSRIPLFVPASIAPGCFAFSRWLKLRAHARGIGNDDHVAPPPPDTAEKAHQCEDHQRASAGATAEAGSALLPRPVGLQVPKDPLPQQMAGNGCIDIFSFEHIHKHDGRR